MMITSLAARAAPRSKLPGSAAALLDVFMLVILMLIIAIASLVIHRPEREDMPVEMAGGAGAAAPAPAVTLTIREGRVALAPGPAGMTPVGLDGLPDALAPHAGGEGPIALCVDDVTPFREVVGVAQAALAELGPRDILGCGRPAR